jgi:transposase
MRQPYNTDLSSTEWEIIAPMLPKPSKLGRPPKTDFREVMNGIFYQQGFVVESKRWVVERTFAWIGKYRRLSKDYEFYENTSESFIYMALIRKMLRNLTAVNS